MILADTSVWINFFKGKETPQVARLMYHLKAGEVVIGDLILLEILRGTRQRKEFTEVKRLLDIVPCYDMCSKERAIQCAEHHLELKKLGITVRKTIDEIIASFCIEMELPLLYEDRDFNAFENHFGLVNAMSLTSE